MSETLGQKQERFAHALALWIIRVAELGYSVRMGECLRSDEQAEINAMGSAGREILCRAIEASWPALAAKIRNNAGSGIRNSLHELKLAADINLFKGGVFISDGKSPDWVRCGELWESMGPDHCWGGRFGDGNHLSIAHDGKK
jgi:hypothetical protein